MPEFPRPESTGRVRELEWPQEIACLFEVGSDRHNLVDQIFHTNDAELAEFLFNDAVVGQRNTLPVDFAVSALVD